MQKNKLLFLIYAGIIAFIALIFVSYNAAPRFTAQIVGLLFVAIFFMASEQWYTHDAAEFENRFWTFMAFFLSTTLLICEDSPIKFPKEREGIAWCIVLLSTYVSHNYDRHLRRLVLLRRTNIPKPISAEFSSNEERDSKVLQLKQYVDSIDLRWMSSFFLNILFLSRVLHAESSIIQFFRDLSKDELNWFMRHAPIALILYKVKDHKVAGRTHRSQLLALLAKERVIELELHSKACLLDALQRLKLNAHPLIAYYVKTIISSTKGDDLSELKCMTDAKGDINSMHKLVFCDIRNADTRAEILQYITKQANIQAAHQLIRSKAGRRRVKFAWRKILSDIDDTLTCSGGSWPKGMDTSYPKHILYPGVVAFYRELDLGVNGEDEWDPKHRVSNLVFLSARPHVYKDVSEAMAYSQFDNLRNNHGLHCNPSLLAGSLESGSKFMAGGNLEPLAKTKYHKFIEYIQLYPEFQCIFIGDNGQGDVRAAEMLLTNELYKKNLCRTYIHIVQPLSKTFVQMKDTFVKRTTSTRVNRALYEKTSWQNPFPVKKIARSTAYSYSYSSSSASRSLTSTAASSSSTNSNAINTSDTVCPICYFYTYIEAAIDAYSFKHIRISGLRRIADESKKAFESIKVEDWLSIALEYIDLPYIRQTTVRPLKVNRKERSWGKWVRVLSATEANKIIMAHTNVVNGGNYEVSATRSISSFLSTPQRKASLSNTTTAATTTAATSSNVMARERAPSWSLPGSTVVEDIVKKIRSNSFTDEPQVSRNSSAISLDTINETAMYTLDDALTTINENATTNEAAGGSATGTKSSNSVSSLVVVPGNAAKKPVPTTGKKINGLIQRELRLRELNNGIEEVNVLLLYEKMQPIDLIPYPLIHPVGRIVSTPFGAGSILSHRATDGIYEIVIPPVINVGNETIPVEKTKGMRIYVPGYQLYD